MAAAYETLEVPVAGGRLHVGRWGHGPATVLGIHGLTLFHVGFHALADQLGDEFTLLAPDLRGRGGSRAVGGPFGLAAHADDLAAVLDHHGSGPATLVGHSWGAVVALVTALRHPDRVARVALVDGGIPHGPPAPGPRAGTNPVERVLQRLRTPFPSAAAYLDTWRAHPGVGPYWNAYIEEHFGYELVGTPPDLRSSFQEEAFLADSADLVGSDLPERALSGLRRPATMLRASRGMFDEDLPLYGEDRVRDWTERVPLLRDMLVPDVNHYTILFTPGGAKAVADLIREEHPCTTS